MLNLEYNEKTKLTLRELLKDRKPHINPLILKSIKKKYKKELAEYQYEPNSNNIKCGDLIIYVHLDLHKISKSGIVVYIHYENNVIEYIKLQRNGRIENGIIVKQKIYSAFKPSRYYIFKKQSLINLLDQYNPTLFDSIRKNISPFEASPPSAPKSLTNRSPVKKQNKIFYTTDESDISSSYSQLLDETNDDISNNNHSNEKNIDTSSSYQSNISDESDETKEINDILNSEFYYLDEPLDDNFIYDD